jgi:hypothetical protein
MNRSNKALIFLLMTGLLVSSAQATVNDEPVTTQVAGGIKQGFSRYNEVLAILVVAGIGCGLFWYHCAGLLSVPEIDAIKKDLAEIVKLGSLLQDEATLSRS